MPRTSDAVANAAELIRERISELDAERKQLERALATLTEGREGRRGPGRPKGSSGNGGRPRRRRRGGTRADEAAKMVAENPGITAGEIAQRMKIKPNYMYRVMADLEKDGRVRKEGRKYSPAQ